MEAFISMLNGYRPSSALQALFSVYHGVFSVCLQNLIWTCLTVLLSKCVSYDKNSGTQISHPYSNKGLTRASKSLFLIVTVVASEFESYFFIVDRTL